MQLAPELEETLRAVVDRIIPADDYPSASENGVLGYIDRLIEMDTTGARRYTYEAGLAALDGEARARLGRAFVDLSDAEQDQVLSAVEANDVQTRWPLPTAEFFLTAVYHTAEGYYGDPGQGGNPDRVSWRMVGYIDRPGVDAA